MFASGRVKEGPFTTTVGAKVNQNFSFSQRWSFLLARAAISSGLGLLGISTLIEFILFFSNLYTRPYQDSRAILGICRNGKRKKNVFYTSRWNSYS